MSTVPNIQVPTIHIAHSTARFPVRRIFCVGQNYADHAREMGSDPERQPPFFFSKPADAAVATLLVSDGEVLVGARQAVGLAPASLYSAGGPPGARELGWCMASEPLWPDDRGIARFREVPAGHLAVARRGSEPLVEALS